MSFSIIYHENNSSPDFVNIIAYLHGVFGKAPSGAYELDWPGYQTDEVGYSIISRRVNDRNG